MATDRAPAKTQHRRLGRGLMNTQPLADCREFDEGQEVLCQLVVSGSDPPGTATLSARLVDRFEPKVTNAA